MQTGPVPAILARQTPEGHWEGERSYYTPKYTSTHWSMTLLMEFAADPADPRLQRGADFMLSATERRVINALAPEQQDWGCFWGNLLRYVVYCGRADDPRVARFVEVIALASGARGWGCRFNDEIACAWGAARALWALAALPERLRMPQVEAAIQSGLDFLLGGEYALVRGDYPTPGSIHKHWSRLNFPLFYQADILFTLRALADLDALDHPQAQAALDWLADRQQPDGRWRGATPYGANTWSELGGGEESSRWASLQAAMLLKQAGRL
jgi:hypothetical protein